MLSSFHLFVFLTNFCLEICQIKDTKTYSVTKAYTWQICLVHSFLKCCFEDCNLQTIQMEYSHKIIFFFQSKDSYFVLIHCHEIFTFLILFNLSNKQKIYSRQENF